MFLYMNKEEMSAEASISVAYWFPHTNRCDNPNTGITSDIKKMQLRAAATNKIIEDIIRPLSFNI